MEKKEGLENSEWKVFRNEFLQRISSVFFFDKQFQNRVIEHFYEITESKSIILPLIRSNKSQPPFASTQPNPNLTRLHAVQNCSKSLRNQAGARWTIFKRGERLKISSRKSKIFHVHRVLELPSRGRFFFPETEPDSFVVPRRGLQQASRVFRPRESGRKPMSRPRL